MVHGKVALKTETNITKYELNQTHKLLSVVDRLYSRFISKNIIYEINQISRNYFSKLGRVRDQKGCITLDTLRTTIKVIIFHKCVFIDYQENFSKYLELSRPICVKFQLKPA